MRYARIMLSVALFSATLAGCTGYYGYGNQNRGYYGNPGYYGNSGYYGYYNNDANWNQPRRYYYGQGYYYPNWYRTCWNCGY